MLSRAPPTGPPSRMPPAPWCLPGTNQGIPGRERRAPGRPCPGTAQWDGGDHEHHRRDRDPCGHTAHRGEPLGRPLAPQRRL